MFLVFWLNLIVHLQFRIHWLYFQFFLWIHWQTLFYIQYSDYSGSRCFKHSLRTLLLNEERWQVKIQYHHHSIKGEQRLIQMFLRLFRSFFCKIWFFMSKPKVDHIFLILIHPNLSWIFTNEFINFLYLSFLVSEHLCTFPYILLIRPFFPIPDCLFLFWDPKGLPYFLNAGFFHQIYFFLHYQNKLTLSVPNFFQYFLIIFCFHSW